MCYKVRTVSAQAHHKSKTFPASKGHGHRHRGKFLMCWESLLVYSVLGRERRQQGDMMQVQEAPASWSGHSLAASTSPRPSHLPQWLPKLKTDNEYI